MFSVRLFRGSWRLKKRAITARSEHALTTLSPLTAMTIAARKYSPKFMQLPQNLPRSSLTRQRRRKGQQLASVTIL